MMDDLISRATAIAEIEEYIEEYSELEPKTGYHNLKWCAMKEVKGVLSTLPAVDAVPVVHGYWYVYPDVCVCSVCGEDSLSLSKYCPNCGALMDKESKEAWE